MSVYLSPNARQQFFDANGNPLVGGKLYTYQSGTTTPQATYTDYTGAYAHTNPVILDSRGEAEVYWLNSLYTVVLKDADDNVVYTQDGVAPAFASGNLVYKGTWNAATNTPSLASGIGTTGDYYVVSVAGTTSLDGVASWAVGDWAVFGTTAWQKTPMGSTYGSAVNTTYDNTTSGLTATNVQAAIDEVDALVDATVRLTGDQTVAGVKTFSSSPVIPDGDSATEAIAYGQVATANAAPVKTALNASGSAPIYACRAWVNFNGTGTVAIRASGNVSSITDNGTGDYTINFTSAMPDANYSASGFSQIDQANQPQVGEIGPYRGSGYLPDASSIRIHTCNGAQTLTDVLWATVSIFR